MWNPASMQGKAMELFLDRYNCAQSVFTAFCDLHGMEERRLCGEFFLEAVWDGCGGLWGASAVYLWQRACCMDMTVLMTRTPRLSTCRRIQELARAFKERTGTLCWNFWAWEERERTASYRLMVGPKPTISRALQGAGWIPAAILDAYLADIPGRHV